MNSKIVGINSGTPITIHKGRGSWTNNPKGLCMLPKATCAADLHFKSQPFQQLHKNIQECINIIFIEDRAPQRRTSGEAS